MRDETKQDISSRLKSIEGHVRGVCRMVDENAYCIDIIKQTNAIQSALDRVNVIILDEHLKTCVTTAMRSDQQSERERVLAELVEVFQAGSKI
jgi:CsoR family transcriptional regulator, copper-sensing transcriptional repressor